MESEKVIFEMEHGKHKKTLYDVLVTSRGDKLVKCGSKTYSPSGWEKIRKNKEM